VAGDHRVPFHAAESDQILPTTHALSDTIHGDAPDTVRRVCGICALLMPGGAPGLARVSRMNAAPGHRRPARPVESAAAAP